MLPFPKETAPTRPTRRTPVAAALTVLLLLSAGCDTDAIGPADGPIRFAAVAAGDRHTCAESTQGETWCWGFEAMGRLGFLSEDPPCEDDACLEPVRAFGRVAFRTLSAGTAHNCGIAGDEAFCWGWGWRGQIGDANTLYQRCMTPDGDDPLPCAIDPVSVALGFPVVDVSAGGEHSCAVTIDGSAYCWGLNQFGQRGDGSTTNTALPTAVAGPVRFAHVSASISHSCGLATDDTAWCWGSNAGGRLGDPSGSDSPIPVPVAGDIHWRAIDAGHIHNCGIATNGLAYCWGTGNGGRLGNGADTSSAVPQLVRLTVGPVWRISAGDGHACAIAGGNHDVHCWGNGFAGQLGNGLRVNRPFPIRAAVDGPFRDVSAGKLHTCAVHEDGRMFCWGSNDHGQLGTGDRVMQVLPHPVAHDAME